MGEMRRLENGELVPAIEETMMCEIDGCKENKGEDYIRNQEDKDGTDWDNEPIYLCEKHSEGHKKFENMIENYEPQKPDEDYKPPKVENVGEAFMDWAEKGWAFEKILTLGMNNLDVNSEACPYKYLREHFVNKINELVKNKV